MSNSIAPVLDAALNVWPARDFAPIANTCYGAYATALSHNKGILSLGGSKGNRVHMAIKTRNLARLQELLLLPR